MANYVNQTGGVFESVSVGGKIINGDITTEKNNLNSCRRLIKAEINKHVTIKSEYAVYNGYYGYFVNDTIKIYAVDNRGETKEGILIFCYAGTGYSLRIEFTGVSEYVSLGMSVSGAGNSVSFTIPSNLRFCFFEYTPEVTTITVS